MKLVVFALKTKLKNVSLKPTTAKCTKMMQMRIDYTLVHIESSISC